MLPTIGEPLLSDMHHSRTLSDVVSWVAVVPTKSFLLVHLDLSTFMREYERH